MGYNKWNKYINKRNTIDKLEKCFVRYYVGNKYHMVFCYVTNQDTYITITDCTTYDIYPPYVNVIKYTGIEKDHCWRYTKDTKDIIATSIPIYAIKCFGKF